MRKIALRMLGGILSGAIVATASPAFAWTDLGHEVTALIAYRYLTPRAKAELDALISEANGNAALLARQAALAGVDSDGSDLASLNDADFRGWSTWADRFRIWYPRSRSWHLVEIALDTPNLGEACAANPDTGSAPASAGPETDCIVNKLYQFTNEARNRDLDRVERILALKFIVHLVGDVHQPLHTANDDDASGNCVVLAIDGGSSDIQLHAYWDTVLIGALGNSADEIANGLSSQITPEESATWSAGLDEWFGGRPSPWAATWALESFQVARTVAYDLPRKQSCDQKYMGAPVNVSAAYQAASVSAASTQLKRAGVRLAALLNKILD